MDIKSSELFRNIKTLPPKGTEEFSQLIKWEVEKCMGGVNINGIHIPGWLYWHTNHWPIRVDKKDAHGNIVRAKSLPDLRDNEWERATALEEAKIQQKGYIEVGARQGGKSEMEASYTGYNATLFEQTQNVVVGGNDADLTLIKDKISFGVRNGWEGIMIPFLDKNWIKSMIRLGFKQRNNDDEIWSYIVIRNVSDGNNTEGPAGVTAKSYVGDEIGKYAFAQAFEAAKPAFVSEYGWRCVPILVGTGGAFEKGADAERYFYHPDANNFLSFTDEKTGKRTGKFMSGVYRQDCKKLSTLADFLLDKEVISPGHDISELQQIPIKVTDEVLALETIKKERALKANDPDQTEYLKLKMYYPLTPDECFLSDSENFFNTELAKKQHDKLKSDYPGLKIGMRVDLEEKEGKIIHKTSTKVPVTGYPRKKDESTNCPIVVLEHPIPDPPYGLYVCGIDPYRFEKAMTSDSMGAAYIFKRAYDALSDSFQNMPVAWYVARPDSKDEWNRNVKNLIKYYNAIALCENDEMSFIDYMIRENEGHRLMDTPDWIKEYNPTSAANLRQKGISAAPRNIELFNTNLKQYMEEVFATVPVPGTTDTYSLYGVNKIMDPALLEEVIKWNRDGNFDRIRALSIAITASRKMDAQNIIPYIPDENAQKQKPRQRIITPFKEINRRYQYPDRRTQLQRLLK